MTRRIWKASILLGIIFLLVSFASGNLVNRSVNSEDGVYTGLLIITNGDVTVNAVNFGDGNFSLYMLEFDYGLQLLEEESLQNVAPFFSAEDVASYTGSVDLPYDGAFFLVVTNSSSSFIQISIVVNRAIPNIRSLSLSVILLTIGIVTGKNEILEYIQKAKTIKSN